MLIIHHHIDEIQHAELTQDELTAFIDSLLDEGFDYGQNDTETMDGEAYVDIYWWNDETPENESHGRAHVKVIEVYHE
jgi:hypothetical protein